MAHGLLNRSGILPGVQRVRRVAVAQFVRQDVHAQLAGGGFHGALDRAFQLMPAHSSTTSQASRSATARACVIVRTGVVPLNSREQRALTRAVAAWAVILGVIVERGVLVVVEPVSGANSRWRWLFAGFGGFLAHRFIGGCRSLPRYPARRSRAFAPMSIAHVS